MEQGSEICEGWCVAGEHDWAQKKSDDHGRQVHRLPLGSTKLTKLCAWEYCTHPADAGSSNVCFKTALVMLYVYTIYLIVRAGVARWCQQRCTDVSSTKYLTEI